MSRSHVDPLAALPASLRALNPALNARVAKAVHHRRTGSGRRADAVGRAWEALVGHALDALLAAGLVVDYVHPHPRRLKGGKPVEAAGVDYVGATVARPFVLECKRDGAEVWLVPALARAKGRRCALTVRQREQLARYAAAGHLALLALDLGGDRAVVPWEAVRDRDRIVRADLGPWRCRALADGLRREMEAPRAPGGL